MYKCIYDYTICQIMLNELSQTNISIMCHAHRKFRTENLHYYVMSITMNKLIDVAQLYCNWTNHIVTAVTAAIGQIIVIGHM